MDVTPLVKQGQQIIQSYSGGRFKVSGERHDGAIVVFPSETQDWAPSSHDICDLSVDDFEAVLAAKDELDVILFGTGANQEFLQPALKTALKKNGVHVDVMDTGAACRTYNVLMAEGRRVAALLMPSE